MIKADSKGRLTGAEPGIQYIKSVDPMGKITYTPRVPREFENHKDVTVEEFEAFFGLRPEEVCAAVPEVYQLRNPEGYYANGLVYEYFLFNSDGTAQFHPDSGERIRHRMLIRIIEE